MSLLCFGGCTQSDVATIDGDVAFTGVSVLDVAADTLAVDQLVIIDDGVITHVADAASVALGSVTQVVPADGQVLIPGLADMHSHAFSKEDLAVMLSYGITTIRTMWGEPSLLELRRQVDAGDIPGPSIITAGPIVSGDPPIHFGTDVITEPGQASALIDAQIEAGYDFIKIYERISLPVFDALAKEAKARGVEMSGHVPQAVSLDHAVASGMRTAEHLLGYLTGIESQPKAFPLRRSLINEKTKETLKALGRGDVALDALYSKEKFDALTTLLARADFYTVPTLVTLRGAAGVQRYDPAMFDLMTPAVKVFWQFAEMEAQKRPQTFRDGWLKLYALQEAMLKAIHDKGGTILAGTDHPNPGAPLGASVATEIELLHDAGLSPIEALRTATTAPAAYLGKADTMGAIKPGYQADLVLLTGDPRADLSVLEVPLGVVTSGTYYERDKLDAMLEDVKAAYGDRMAPFADRPQAVAGPFSSLFVDGQGHLAALGMMLPNQPVTQAWRPSDNAPWQSMAYNFADGTATLTRSVASSARQTTLTVTDGTARLKDSKGHASNLDASEGAAIAVLTGTPLDAPQLMAAFKPLAVGGTMTLEGWMCPPEQSCSDTPISWRVTRQGDAAVPSYFYYAGSRVYEAASETGAHDFTVWLGGGFYEGQIIQLAMGPALWQRRQ